MTNKKEATEIARKLRILLKEFNEREGTNVKATAIIPLASGWGIHLDFLPSSVSSREELIWHRRASKYGVDPSLLNQRVSLRGKQVIVRGLTSSSIKTPLVLEDMEGKRFHYSIKFLQEPSENYTIRNIVKFDKSF